MKPRVKAGYTTATLNYQDEQSTVAIWEETIYDASVDHLGLLNACDHFHSGCVQFAAALLAFLNRSAFGSMANTRLSRCAHPKAAPIGRSHSVCLWAHLWLSLAPLSPAVCCWVRTPHEISTGRPRHFIRGFGTNAASRPTNSSGLRMT